MSAPSTRSTRLRFALVGAGSISRTHARVMQQLADQIELVAVVDVHDDRARALADEYGGRTFASLTEALAAVDVDAVAVCTPTGRHGEVAIEALNAGLHVIIEKPAEVTLAKTDRIIEAQRRAGCVVAVISQHRFDSSTEIALQAISDGALGRVTSGTAAVDWWRGQSYYDSAAWRGTSRVMRMAIPARPCALRLGRLIGRPTRSHTAAGLSNSLRVGVWQTVSSRHPWPSATTATAHPAPWITA